MLFNRVVRVRLAALCVAGLLAHDFRAASLDLPFGDGVSWDFLSIENVADSNGRDETSGPEPFVFQLASVDLQINDQRATLAQFEDGQALPNEAETYFIEQPDGLYIIAEGNPNLNLTYTSYTDPKPLFTRGFIDPDTGLNFDGTWTGQRETTPGSGAFEAWSGIWTASYTDVGAQPIDTPLGRFNATHVREQRFYTKAPRNNPDRVESTTSITDWWLIEGVTLLRFEESIRTEIDFDGNGQADFWEEQQRQAVRVGLFLLPGDTDADGDIDDADLGSAFANYTGAVGGIAGKTFTDADTDGDGDVDDADLGTMFVNYTGALAVGVPVPEPTSAVLLAGLGVAISRRRRVR